VLIGIDLVERAEVQNAIEKWGERYLSRVYTATERQRWRERPSGLAACFAAKEAAMKVLRTGDEPIPWTAIELRDRTSLQLSGAAQDLLEQRRFQGLKVDVVTTRSSACAIVLAITDQTGRPR
jgi:holo-[acyl-carrier protein] synthase